MSEPQPIKDVTTGFFNAGQSWQEASRDLYTSKSLMIVGGVTRPDGALDFVDSEMSKAAMRVYGRDLGLPLSRDLHDLIPSGVAITPGQDVFIQNVDPRFGGQNFVDNKTQADIVILANIPVHHASYGKNLTGSFAAGLSKGNDMASWRSALECTQPNAVFLFGGPECHQLSDVMMADYVALTGVAPECSMLIKRDLLTDLGLYAEYVKGKSPLAIVASILAQDPDLAGFSVSKKAAFKGVGQPAEPLWNVRADQSMLNSYEHKNT